MHTSAFILLVRLLVIAARLSPAWPGTVWWWWLAVERSQPMGKDHGVRTETVDLLCHVQTWYREHISVLK
jgi:hypothetical protein